MSRSSNLKTFIIGAMLLLASRGINAQTNKESTINDIRDVFIKTCLLKVDLKTAQDTAEFNEFIKDCDDLVKIVNNKNDNAQEAKLLLWTVMQGKAGLYKGLDTNDKFYRRNYKSMSKQLKKSATNKIDMNYTLFKVQIERS